VEVTLKTEDLCCYAGKYQGHLLVDGQGLKQPERIPVGIIVTDSAWFLALAIAVGVLVSSLRNKPEVQNLAFLRKGN
jgi:hypothetical protein